MREKLEANKISQFPNKKGMSRFPNHKHDPDAHVPTLFGLDLRIGKKCEPKNVSLEVESSTKLNEV
jgi:hypothetical protein